MPRSVRNYRAFDSIMKKYRMGECIIIADHGLASYEMPKRKGVYLIVAIRRNFNIVDFKCHWTSHSYTTTGETIPE
ncbi:MAG: hypothetical protein QXH07_03250 [Thermoplasmata archaeon]